MEPVLKVTPTTLQLDKTRPLFMSSCSQKPGGPQDGTPGLRGVPEKQTKPSVAYLGLLPQFPGQSFLGTHPALEPTGTIDSCPNSNTVGSASPNLTSLKRKLLEPSAWSLVSGTPSLLTVSADGLVHVVHGKVGQGMSIPWGH